MNLVTLLLVAWEFSVSNVALPAACLEGATADLADADAVAAAAAKAEGWGVGPETPEDDFAALAASLTLEVAVEEDGFARFYDAEGTLMQVMSCSEWP